MIYLDDRVNEIDIDGALALVSAQRREQALRFRQERDRKLSLAAYLLLKRGLRMEYGILENPVLAVADSGKPFLEQHPGIHFSLSHSKTVALCAIDCQPVGADVEVIRRISPELVDYTMNDEEQAWIRASQDTDVAFLSLWTKKEAVLKLTGEGVSNNLKNVLADVGKYLVETVATHQYVFSVAKFNPVSIIS